MDISVLRRGNPFFNCPYTIRARSSCLLKNKWVQTYSSEFLWCLSPLWQDCVTGPHSFTYFFKQTTKWTPALCQPLLWALVHDREQTIPLPSWSFPSKVNYALGRWDKQRVGRLAAENMIRLWKILHLVPAAERYGLGAVGLFSRDSFMQKVMMLSSLGLLEKLI